MRVYKVIDHFGKHEIKLTPSLDGYYKDKVIDSFELAEKEYLVKIKTTIFDDGRRITDVERVSKIVFGSLEEMQEAFNSLRYRSCHDSDICIVNFRAKTQTHDSYVIWREDAD